MTKEEIIEQVEYYISDPARWHNSNGKARIALSTMIEELITAPTAKPNVSGELLFDSKCCANCKHFIDKWPYKSECNFHGSKANITHAEEQCCDNWGK